VGAGFRVAVWRGSKLGVLQYVVVVMMIMMMMMMMVMVMMMMMMMMMVFGGLCGVAASWACCST
jgi:hypothetical protein